jgi:predicted Fe-Mo cluster-binding NifX family protein
MVRIAISAENNDGLDSQVSHHFGRCPFFVLVDVEGDTIKRTDVIQNPFASNHQPGMVPGFIHEQGADVMLSGGMGRRAMGFFEQYGIRPATGASGSVGQTLQRYLEGGMNDAEPCRESVEHEKHGHHRM